MDTSTSTPNTVDARDLTALIDRARSLAEALPYVKRFAGHSIGGKEISKWMKRMGKEAVFIDGLRFTDAETMEITEMVLTGKINSELVSLINSRGGKAVGLSGRDAGMIIGARLRGRDDRDLGQVGRIERADVGLLRSLSGSGYVPVVSSVAEGEDGQTLNVNADHAAAGLAAALGALKLIYLTDVRGVMGEGESLIERMDPRRAVDLIESGVIGEGMIPKVHSAIEAVQGGVGAVHVIDGRIEHALLLELLTDRGIGTMIASR
jgi:acetylglutamate kinase